jgi:hypothetical protein
MEDAVTPDPESIRLGAVDRLSLGHRDDPFSPPSRRAEKHPTGRATASCETTSDLNCTRKISHTPIIYSATIEPKGGK